MHPLIKVQTERLALYFGIFLLGATYQIRQSFKAANEDHTGKHSIAVCLVAFAAFSLVRHFAYDAIPGGRMGFFLIHSTASTIRAFSAVFLLLFAFKSVLNRTSGLQAMLSRNSYGVYIIHYLLMAVVFIAVVFMLTFLLCNEVVHMGRKI